MPNGTGPARHRRVPASAPTAQVDRTKGFPRCRFRAAGRRSHRFLSWAVQQGKSHFLPGLQVSRGAQVGQSSYAPDVGCPLGDTHSTPGVKNVEEMGTLQTTIVRRQGESPLDQTEPFSLVMTEDLEVQVHIGFLKIVPG